MRDKKVESVLGQIQKEYGNSVSNGEVSIKILATMDVLGPDGKFDTEWKALLEVKGEKYWYDSRKKHSNDNDQFIKVFRKIFQLD